MKVIFLDIDGVLCVHKDYNCVEKEKFDDKACKNLKKIIDTTGCKLVLTSSWRLYSEYIDLMLKQLKSYGITSKDFFGKTGVKDSRAKEIYSCLQRHPEITEYVVLDDELIVSPLIPKGKIIRTMIQTGITDDIVIQVQNLLN